MDEIEEPLPRWAERKSEGDYMEIGAQLCTRDGRKIGNAVVLEIIEDYGKVFAHICTDMGSRVRLTEREMQGMFYPPTYIVKIQTATL